MAEPTPRPPADDGASTGAPATKSRARGKLLAIVAIGLAPAIASYAFYYLAPRHARVNYGTLLPTGPAPALAGTTLDGQPFDLALLKGRWVLLVPAAGRCDATCERDLYATRQARTMQGKEQERIVRVLVVADDAAPEPSLLAQHPGLVVARVAPAALARLPAASGAFVIDPLGNLVMRYDTDPDIKGVAKDLTRLLKASGIG